MDKSVFDGLLAEIERMVGPKVTAATYRKIERAQTALRRFEAQADADAAREAAKSDYVVTLVHPEHGEVKVAQRATTAAEAERLAKRKAPGYAIVGSVIGK